MLNRLTERLIRSAAYHGRAIERQGVIGWALQQLQRRSPGAARALGNRFWPCDSRHPLHYRPDSSDPIVYCQVFDEKQYDCLPDFRRPQLILDCGANVGYTTAFFLSRYPGARVIAVEPDPGNFHVLQRNVARFGSRVRAVQAGVWSRACGLKFENGSYRDGLQWTIRVREAAAGEAADITAVDVGTLLRDSGFDRISILKMDIERSELAVFGADCGGWLPRCDCIMIELHDDECERVFLSAIDDQGFVVSRHGELTVCVRPKIAARIVLNGHS
ncbi:MAG: FkbM family methyltransferase [Gemmataceae bacterium]